MVIVSDVDLASCSSSLSIRDTLMGFPQNRRLFNQWKYLGANVNLTSNSDVKSWYSHSGLQCREPWKKSPPIQHFHCSTFRHCKLLFANLSRTNFSICYKLPQILKLLQISRRDCIFARLLGHFPLHLLLICSIVLQMSTCNPLWKLLIARFGFVELCAAGRHEIKISKVLRLIRTREGKKVDLQDFSFVAKSGGVCASRRGARPPVTFYLFAAATKFNLQPIQPQGLTSKTIIV